MLLVIKIVYLTRAAQTKKNILDILVFFIYIHIQKHIHTYMEWKCVVY